GVGPETFLPDASGDFEGVCGAPLSSENLFQKFLSFKPALVEKSHMRSFDQRALVVSVALHALIIALLTINGPWFNTTDWNEASTGSGGGQSGSQSKNRVRADARENRRRIFRYQ